VAFLRLRCEHIGFLSWYRRFLPRHPAPPLRGEIQSATCVDSPHRARSPHVVPCIHLCSLLAAATERRGEARLARCGLPPRVAMSWACAISPTPVCFTHTEPTPQKKAGSSWIANAIDACCVSARAALRVSAPVAMAAANGARPAASVRLCCWWLHRGHTTCLHLAAWVAWFAHATAPAGMAAPTPSGPPHRLTFGAGSIERTTRSMSRMGSTGEPTRHVCRYGCRQQRQPHLVGSLFVRCCFPRRRPLPASAAVRAVRLLPAANAFRPAHRLPPQLWLPFSAEVAAPPSPGLAAMAAANGIQSCRRLRSPLSRSCRFPAAAFLG
jgi:hypothetical protein